MARCPHCASRKFYVSRQEDRWFYRLLLVARVRCHDCFECFECFFAPRWQARSYRDRVAPPAPHAKSAPTRPPATANRQRG